jgi:hypothetical protein
VKDVFREEALAVNADACVIRSAMPDVQDRSALAAALDVEPAHAHFPLGLDALRRRRS